MKTLSKNQSNFKSFLAIHKDTGRIFNVNRVVGGIIKGKKYLQFICSLPDDESSYLFNQSHIMIKAIN